MTAEVEHDPARPRRSCLLADRRVLLALLSIVFLLCVALRSGGRRATDIIDNVGELVAPLVAAAMCGVASRKLSRPGSPGRCSPPPVRPGAPGS